MVASFYTTTCLKRDKTFVENYGIQVHFFPSITGHGEITLRKIYMYTCSQPPQRGPFRTLLDQDGLQGLLLLMLCKDFRLHAQFTDKVTKELSESLFLLMN